MIIGRTSSIYRPYFIEVNGKSYKVDTIKFYNNDGVLVSTNVGWLQSGEGSLNDIESIELPIDKIYLRRKLKFDGVVFAMIERNMFNETVAYLYIPADMLSIHFVEHKIQYGYQVRAIYEGAYGIYISSYVKSLDEKLNAIRNEYEEMHKSVNDYKLSINRNFDEVISKIDKLKELAEAYNAERKRLDNLIVDDIEL